METVRLGLPEDTLKRARAYAEANGVELPAALRMLVQRALDADTIDQLLMRASAALTRQERGVEDLSVEILSRLIVLQAQAGAVNPELENINRQSINQFLRSRRARRLGRVEG